MDTRLLSVLLGTRASRATASSIGLVCACLRSEWFVLALILVVMAASVLPCYGVSAEILSRLAVLTISSLFFLQGARLSRDAVFGGMIHWRLHLAIMSTTFVLFPVLGLGVVSLFESALSEPLRIGVLFVCALPSTVQSSIALTSIARGNIPGAICAAATSNLIGILLTPLLLTALVHVHGGSFDFAGLWKIVLQLLVPFTAGHLLRSRIGDWVDRNRAVLAITDRGSILLVVYVAFSGAVTHGIWQQLPPATLALLVLIDGMLLIAVLVLMTVGSRALAASRVDEVAVVFCGSQKSLVTGVPMANVVFAGSAVGVILLPIMLYHMLQLLVCAWLARRYARPPAATRHRMGCTPALGRKR